MTENFADVSFQYLLVVFVARIENGNRHTMRQVDEQEADDENVVVEWREDAQKGDQTVWDVSQYVQR